MKPKLTFCPFLFEKDLDIKILKQPSPDVKPDIHQGGISPENST
jgi:hypothetical protein